MAARCRGFASSLHPYCSQESVSSPEVRMFIFWVSAPETQRGNLEIVLFHETSSTTMRLASHFPRTALRRAGRRDSHLLDLPELQIHRRRAAENRDGDFDARARLVDFLDHAAERGERPVGDPHLLADVEADRGFRPLDAFGDLALDSLGLDVGDRHRLLVGAEKAGDFRRVLDQVVDVVGQIAFDQHVAGKELSLRTDLAAAPDLDDLLGRHHDLFELLGEAALRRLLFQRFGDLLFEIRISVDDVPAHAHIDIRSEMSGDVAPWLESCRSAMTADSQREADGEMDDFVDRQEEQARQDHHQQDQPGRDQRLAPARPDDFRAFGAHLLNEFEWIGHDKGPRAEPRRRLAAGQKDLRRGTSRPRATPVSYRKAPVQAKGNFQPGSSSWNVRLWPRLSRLRGARSSARRQAGWVFSLRGAAQSRTSI